MKIVLIILVCFVLLLSIPHTLRLGASKEGIRFSWRFLFLFLVKSPGGFLLQIGPWRIIDGEKASVGEDRRKQHEDASREESAFSRRSGRKMHRRERTSTGADRHRAGVHSPGFGSKESTHGPGDIQKSMEKPQKPESCPENTARTQKREDHSFTHGEKTYAQKDESFGASLQRAWRRVRRESARMNRIWQENRRDLGKIGRFVLWCVGMVMKTLRPRYCVLRLQGGLEDPLWTARLFVWLNTAGAFVNTLEGMEFQYVPDYTGASWSGDGSCEYRFSPAGLVLIFLRLLWYLPVFAGIRVFRRFRKGYSL
ncbi:MAG: hypothetical protein ACQEQV_05975 [Fibrobacterota bacterium]